MFKVTFNLIFCQDPRAPAATTITVAPTTAEVATIGAAATAVLALLFLRPSPAGRTHTAAAADALVHDSSAKRVRFSDPLVSGEYEMSSDSSCSDSSSDEASYEIFEHLPEHLSSQTPVGRAILSNVEEGITEL